MLKIRKNNHEDGNMVFGAKMKRKSIMKPIARQRTFVVASSKGGVNKTSLSSGLAFEAARLGLQVLCVDGDGTGGFSSTLGAYAPEDSPNIVDFIEGHAEAAAAIYPVPEWRPNPRLPWIKGGPAIDGGTISILPATPSEEGQKSVASVISQGGTTRETRLADRLNVPEITDNFDLIIIDMPGTDDESTISAMLHAAEFIVFPFFPQFFAMEALKGTDVKIDAWCDATGKDITFLGGIPTSIPTRLTPNMMEREVLELSSAWMNKNSDGNVRVIAPGIEFRKAVARAHALAVPVSTLSQTQIELRNLGTIPAAFTRTLLTILKDMRPTADDPDTYRVNFPVDEMQKAVLAQPMPDDWRTIISGPEHLPWDAYSRTR